MDHSIPRPDGPDKAEKIEELYHQMQSVASATECTGLMPTPPVDKSEADSYNDIYDIPTTDKNPNHNLQSMQKTFKPTQKHSKK